MLNECALLLLPLVGQGSWQHVDDSDKRGFDELAPLHFDLDGDGRLDAIRPRIYKLRPRPTRSSQGDRPRQEHWIAFDLRLPTGATRKSFFRYRYGDDRADYWVWAVKPAGDLNHDGRMDLVFYTGDDTTDETVVLLQKGNGFKAVSSGLILCEDCVLDDQFNVVMLGRYDVDAGTSIPDRIIGRWNPRREYFEGIDLYWVRAQRTAMRSTPDVSGELVEWLRRDDAVAAVRANGHHVTRGTWIQVEAQREVGWVGRRDLVATSQTTRP